MEKPVIYQLLPRLFGNINNHCVPNGTIEENGCGKLADINPQVLESLRQLGVTHVWYTGVIRHATQTDYSAHGIPKNNPHVVKGKAGSPYAIVDYYDIDPDLAVEVDKRQQEFDALVERTHRAGLKVIIDFVPNHVAREYHSIARPDGISDLGEGDDTGMFFARNNNFYYLTGQTFAPTIGCGDYHEFPAKATGNDCYSASPSENDWYETIKLNYGIDPWNGSRHFDPIPDTWHKMLHIILYWADRGIDGLRCDMAHMVPVEFWHWAIGQVKAHYPHLFFIAEIYDVALYDSYINYGGFDYLYDKVTLYDSLVNVLKNSASAHTLTSCWQTINPWRGHMLHFMENHDEVRLASRHLCGDGRLARPAVVVSATIDTCPMMVYCGQELGENGDEAEGYRGADGRTTIFDYWSMHTIRQWLSRPNLDRRNPLRDYYRRVLQLCRQERAIAFGEMFDLMYVNSHLQQQYAYLRYVDKELLLVVANFAVHDNKQSVVLPAHAFDYLGITPGQYRGNELLHGGSKLYELVPDCSIDVTIKANDAVVLKFFVK